MMITTLSSTSLNLIEESTSGPIRNRIIYYIDLGLTQCDFSICSFSFSSSVYEGFSNTNKKWNSQIMDMYIYISYT